MKPTFLRLAALSAAALLVATGLFARPTTSGPQDGFPDLVSGLKEIEGCLGVETAQTTSGKQVIFAWFESKAAARRWYDSDMHQGAMSFFFGEGSGYEVDEEPMEEVHEDVGPILAIASITMAKEGEGLPGMPFSQIAIEVYTPLTKPISIGGTFSPKGLKVPKRQIVTADEH